MGDLATMAQMKELDRIAIEERGIPSLELMENAAKAVAQAVVNLAGPADGRRSDGVIATATSVVRMRTETEPTAEEQREMEEIRSIVESKNTDPTPRIGIFCGPGQQRRGRAWPPPGSCWRRATGSGPFCWETGKR